MLLTIQPPLLRRSLGSEPTSGGSYKFRPAAISARP